MKESAPRTGNKFDSDNRLTVNIEGDPHMIPPNGPVPSQAFPANTPRHISLRWRRQPREKPFSDPTVVYAKDACSQRLHGVLRELWEGKHSWPAYLHGPVGVGKSTAVRWFCDRTADAVYLYSMSDLRIDAHTLKREKISNDLGYEVSEREYWKRRAGAELVVIDDIGTSRDSSGFNDEILLNLIESRRGRPVIFIGNLSLTQLQAVFDDRLLSRLAGGTVIEVSGEDRRPGQGAYIRIDDPPGPKRPRRRSRT